MINQGQGSLIHHVFCGKSGRCFVPDSCCGSSPSGQQVFTTCLDKDGKREARLRITTATRTEFKFDEYNAKEKRQLRVRIDIVCILLNISGKLPDGNTYYSWLIFWTYPGETVSHFLFCFWLEFCFQE